MLRMQFDYYTDKYRLKKYNVDGKDVFFLYGMQLTFNEIPDCSYISVKGNIPYLLVKDLPEVDPTPEQYFGDVSTPYSSKLQDWVSSKLLNEYIYEDLAMLETSRDISFYEIMSKFLSKKAELLAEHPEAFYLLNCHFFTIGGFAAFLEKATAFYDKK